MTKSIFSDDLNAINDVSSQIQFLSFPRLLLSEIVRKYAIDFEDLNDGSYYKKLEGTNERDKIYYFINKLTKWIQYLLKFDAVFLQAIMFTYRSKNF